MGFKAVPIETPEGIKWIPPPPPTLKQKTISRGGGGRRQELEVLYKSEYDPATKRIVTRRVEVPKAEFEARRESGYQVSEAQAELIAKEIQQAAEVAQLKQKTTQPREDISKVADVLAKQKRQFVLTQSGLEIPISGGRKEVITSAYESPVIVPQSARVDPAGVRSFIKEKDRFVSDLTSSQIMLTDTLRKQKKKFKVTKDKGIEILDGKNQEIVTKDMFYVKAPKSAKVSEPSIYPYVRDTKPRPATFWEGFRKEGTEFGGSLIRGTTKIASYPFIEREKGKGLGGALGGLSRSVSIKKKPITVPFLPKEVKEGAKQFKTNKLISDPDVWNVGGTAAFVAAPWQVGVPAAIGLVGWEGINFIKNPTAGKAGRLAFDVALLGSGLIVKGISKKAARKIIEPKIISSQKSIIKTEGKNIITYPKMKVKAGKDIYKVQGLGVTTKQSLGQRTTRIGLEIKTPEGKTLMAKELGVGRKRSDIFKSVIEIEKGKYIRVAGGQSTITKQITPSKTKVITFESIISKTPTKKIDINFPVKNKFNKFIPREISIGIIKKPITLKEKGFIIQQKIPKLSEYVGLGFGGKKYIKKTKLFFKEGLPIPLKLKGRLLKTNIKSKSKTIITFPKSGTLLKLKTSTPYNLIKPVSRSNLLIKSSIKEIAIQKTGRRTTQLIKPILSKSIYISKEKTQINKIKQKSKNKFITMSKDKIKFKFNLKPQSTSFISLQPIQLLKSKQQTQQKVQQTSRQKIKIQQNIRQIPKQELKYKLISPLIKPKGIKPRVPYLSPSLKIPIFPTIPLVLNSKKSTKKKKKKVFDLEAKYKPSLYGIELFEKQKVKTKKTPRITSGIGIRKVVG